MTNGMSINGNEVQQQPVRKPWKVGTYAKTQAGLFNVPVSKDENYALNYANGALGVKAQKGNFFASAEVGAGTSATAKAAVGYEIPIGQNFGLELSADARAAQSMIGKKIIVQTNATTINNYSNGITVDDNNFEINTASEAIDFNNVEVGRYKDSNYAVGANVMLKGHATKHLTFGVGARIAHTGGNVANININRDITVHDIQENVTIHGLPNSEEVNITNHIQIPSFINDIKIGKNISKTVVTPVVGVDVNAGKWDFGVKASFDEARAEVVYNLGK